MAYPIASTHRRRAALEQAIGFLGACRGWLEACHQDTARHPVSTGHLSDWIAYLQPILDAWPATEVSVDVPEVTHRGHRLELHHFKERPLTVQEALYLVAVREHHRRNEELTFDDAVCISQITAPPGAHVLGWQFLDACDVDFPCWYLARVYDVPGQQGPYRTHKFLAGNRQHSLELLRAKEPAADLENVEWVELSQRAFTYTYPDGDTVEIWAPDAADVLAIVQCLYPQATAADITAIPVEEELPAPVVVGPPQLYYGSYWDEVSERSYQCMLLACTEAEAREKMLAEYEDTDSLLWTVCLWDPQTTPLFHIPD